jgi:hypothetical protein
VRAAGLSWARHAAEGKPEGWTKGAALTWNPSSTSLRQPRQGLHAQRTGSADSVPSPPSARRGDGSGLDGVQPVAVPGRDRECKRWMGLVETRVQGKENLGGIDKLVQRVVLLSNNGKGEGSHGPLSSTSSPHHDHKLSCATQQQEPFCSSSPPPPQQREGEVKQTAARKLVEGKRGVKFLRQRFNKNPSTDRFVCRETALPRGCSRAPLSRLYRKLSSTRPFAQGGWIFLCDAKNVLRTVNGGLRQLNGT